MRQEYGDFYLHDWRYNIVADIFVEPEPLGRELGVLQAFEHVESA